MKRVLYVISLLTLLNSACAGGRLSHNEVRKRIAEIGASPLVPQAIEIRRIVSQNDTQAIAEASIMLAFQFEKDKQSNQWRIAAVRLGDRDWISLDELLAAVSEARRRDTLNSMQKLAAGIETYRQRNGSLPNAADIVQLTDLLYPQYMKELLREDGWGHSLLYEPMGSNFRLRSLGADGMRGTQDDIVFPDTN